MFIVFCDSVFDPKTVDPDFEEELAAARAAGFNTCLISHEAVTGGDAAEVARFVPTQSELQRAIYRGWMVTPEQYALLHQQLEAKGVQLVNDAAAFRHCHYLPASYDKIAALTAKSNWTDSMSYHNKAEIDRLTDAFGASPIIVKDYVKSEKHNWEDACFIPDASDKITVHAVVDRFLELRGDALNVGLVFRAFEELKPLTTHSQSGMPLTLEYRLFFANSKLLGSFPYWEEGDYEAGGPATAHFEAVASNIESQFFTMDIAQRQSGEWIIMELGDGQTAGLPEQCDTAAFFRSLANHFAQP